jgi:methylmalonyl-CoA mutase
MTVPEETLAEDAEFPRASREQWQRLVAGVLAKSGKTGLTGPEAEEALVTEVEDGLRVRPGGRPGHRRLGHPAAARPP